MNDDRYQQIEDYIFGRLSSADHLAFEEAIEVDPGLAKEVASHREAQRVSQDFLELELRNILENADGATKTNEQSRPLKLWLPLLIIALMGGLLLLQKKFVKTPERPSYASLYEEPKWPLTRSIDGDILKQGISTALNNDFRTGVNQIYQSDTPTDLKSYWIAELFANESMADSSLHYLSKLQGTAFKRDRITYLKILAHNHLGNHEQVQQLIHSLPQDTDEWYLGRYDSLGN